ncbi:EPM2AIP1 [Cordylochernes scorpioides]|uniref:EPM2AIP1 n=1 Tax=Cordylochernes scorpioides TaxID=51811 RepID=A0ABY6KLV6_9ARAC|nr:EPM2AIP1 [Cordylochernes scorpioides]
MPGHRKRRQFKQTDAFTRGMVIGLKRAGWSIRQIAADTHLGASTVHRLWRRWLEQGNVAIYRNVGATRVTSARVDRRILRQAVAAPQATCTAILQHVQDTLDHSISTRTISRRLVANGLHSCRPLRRLPLTPPNRRQRLEWCRARSTWMTEWHRVVFSDESRFCLSSDSRRVSVWRRRGERSNPAAIVERPTVRQRGIMVWGAIAYDSRSPLLRIQGTMTAQRYVDDVLRPVTLPYLQGVPNALYQQDNARPHTARISQQALQDVQMLPWPPYSPDLSPIEHVWDIIGRRLHALPQPRSEDELWQMVEREWRAIPQDAIRTLIDSLPRRVAACIAVRGIVRTEKFEALKRGLKSQQSLFTKVKTEQEAATRASFRVALEIAKRGKPFTDGEMIKECIIAVVEEMCPEKVNLLKTVSMSANTVARRVENIAENISSQLFDKNGHVEWFSLALDESTDVSDTAQVLIYIRGVDKSYEVHEELLDMYSIHGTTTGTDIFKGVEMAINKKNLRWKNLKCITTDGGKNMSGKDKGVVALVSKAVENDGGSKPLVLHCIIHQQSLCGKCLDMSDVLKPVISTVNFIRSFGLNHRQFRQFIAEIGETDLPYHTAVRWLSCEKVLQRFFELRAVIEIFLNEKHRPLTELQNNAWLWKLAFYVDLTKHVNELNLRLQGENQHLPDLYTNIKSFRMKLILFQSQLRSKCFSHFKTCEIFSHTTETEFPIDFAIETLSALKINFDTRFSDFDAIVNQIKIFQNPFDADIETLAPELQMEMIDLQCSDIIKNKYENSSLLEFYKSLPLTQFDNLHKFARGLFSVFGTTYLCEKTFSKMKYTKMYTDLN